MGQERCSFTSSPSPSKKQSKRGLINQMEKRKRKKRKGESKEMVKKSEGISHFSFLSLPLPLFSLTSIVSSDVLAVTTTHYLPFPPPLSLCSRVPSSFPAPAASAHSTLLPPPPSSFGDPFLSSYHSRELADSLLTSCPLV